jgi:hypothetical protein
MARQLGDLSQRLGGEVGLLDEDAQARALIPATARKPGRRITSWPRARPVAAQKAAELRAWRSGASARTAG